MHCYVTVITVKKILQVPYISHAWSKYTEYVMGWNLHSLYLNCLPLSIPTIRVTDLYPSCGWLNGSR